MAEVRIPRVNGTDETYVLLEWLVPAGAAVGAGQPVAAVETSKAVTEVEAGAAGFLAHRCGPGSVCRPGDVIGDVTDAPLAPAPAGPGLAGSAPDGPAPGGPLLTDPARELLVSSGLDPATLPTGNAVIRKADIQALLDAGQHPAAAGSPEAAAAAAAAEGGIHPLSARQRAVARTVARSHATIPSAFSVIKVDADALIDARRRTGERERAFLGQVEQAIAALASLRRDFPVFFATVEDDLTVRVGTAANVGVTVDAGRGLSVPVVHAADRLDLMGIAHRLLRLRVRAARGTLTEPNLAGGNITLAPHLDPGIVLARPIVYPGQVCTVSLCATQRELRFDDATGAPADPTPPAPGRIVERSFFLVGLAYDHRVVNGAEAAAFLAALRDRLQDPDAGHPSGRNPDQTSERDRGISAS